MKFVDLLLISILIINSLIGLNRTTVCYFRLVHSTMDDQDIESIENGNTLRNGKRIKIGPSGIEAHLD